MRPGDEAGRRALSDLRRLQSGKLSPSQIQELKDRYGSVNNGSSRNPIVWLAEAIAAIIRSVFGS